MKKVAGTKKVAVKKLRTVSTVDAPTVAPAVAPINPTTTEGVVVGVKAAKVAKVAKVTKAAKTSKVKDASEAKPRGLRRLKMLLP